MTGGQFESLIDFGDLPFNIGVAESPVNGSFPQVLPFVAGVRRDLGLLVQMPNFIVEPYLEQAYAQGVLLGSPMAEHGIGRAYADDFLAFITRSLGTDELGGLRILEIGCGNGYLLHRLKGLGADVIGVEPGVQGQVGAQQYGLPIIRDLFPSSQAVGSGPFDLIIHYAVLEHIPDPVEFLRAQVPSLASSGRIICAAPACEEYIRSGDISMFCHEHWSYFTPASLAALMDAVGLKVLGTEQARFGGAVYMIAGGVGQATAITAGLSSIEQFLSRVETGISQLRDFFTQVGKEGSSTGVFCPARFLNYLQMVRPQVPPRFFDDDSRLHGKYYPPFAIPIEARAGLLQHPVDDLLIMSRSFGSRLRAELRAAPGMERTRIHLPDDLLALARA